MVVLCSYIFTGCGRFTFISVITNTFTVLLLLKLHPGNLCNVINAVRISNIFIRVIKQTYFKIYVLCF